ncbi:hypothetical protein J8273_5585 [Carpediemonas membranifera]|uniref:Uncharacterized protein n=1 Tax=Carpediemonas membranifera TaxID=201153 RepID=A0A8J6BX15_9EUKA|nr:hypothetical protein J8273_5585 [Carpediemonas membranifera]|eukprot:KAG9392991.1 hypothetical protein J8273_5585 [Carpediemonas membranifera]
MFSIWGRRPPHAVSAATHENTAAAANAIWPQDITRHSTPLCIKSDIGPEYTGKIVQTLQENAEITQQDQDIILAERQVEKCLQAEINALKAKNKTLKTKQEGQRRRGRAANRRGGKRRYRRHLGLLESQEGGEAEEPDSDAPVEEALQTRVTDQILTASTLHFCLRTRTPRNPTSHEHEIIRNTHGYREAICARYALGNTPAGTACTRCGRDCSNEPNHGVTCPHLGGFKSRCHDRIRDILSEALRASSRFDAVFVENQDTDDPTADNFHDVQVQEGATRTAIDTRLVEKASQHRASTLKPLIFFVSSSGSPR